MSSQLRHKVNLPIVLLIFIGILFTFMVLPDQASSRFVNNGDGTVTDTVTGLMWAAKDNGGLINWHNASIYSQRFEAGGYNDWRLPTLIELASLFEPIAKNKHGYHVDQMINITAASCWAADTSNGEAARFNFTYGEVYWLYKSFSGPSRVLPVRTVK